MSYPFSPPQQQVAPAATVEVAFRPAQAGLVHLQVEVTGFPPSGNGGHDGGNPPAAQPRAAAPVTKSYSTAVRILVLKPGHATPAIDLHAGRPLSEGRQLVWGDAMAAAADLSADWTIRLMNTSPNVTAMFDVTVRYQVVSGNLGKIDHVVVLMMENRSFDQMLGYLKLERGRTDVDGLTGSEVNVDVDGTSHTIHHAEPVDSLPATYFRVDPQHGWQDVSEQLGRSGNGNFVTNFGRVTRALYPQSLTIRDETQLAGGDVHDIPFRPGIFGNVYLRTAIGAHTGPLTTETKNKLLCVLEIFAPGATKHVASLPVHIADWTGQQNVLSSPCGRPVQSGFGLAYDITDVALKQKPGNWTFRITNYTNNQITFESDVTLNLAPVSPGAVMGYYNEQELPVYDFLAAHYLVCNRWFASLPTDTWPNRLYALTGGSGGMIETPSDADVPQHPPGYSMKTIFEVLEEHGVEWNVFFTDLPFPLVFRRLAQQAAYTKQMRPMDEFYARAQAGKLPALSWLEPNFTDVPDGAQFADDDHPPGDVARGQQIIGQIYNALAQSPCWSKTLFLITYDEHGGFFDHVPPPQGAAVADDNPTFKTYGARVPTFIVSPWVKPRSTSNVVFDHTSLLSTLLRRFCTPPGGVTPGMGARTSHAHDVSPVLTVTTSPPKPPLAPSVTPPPQPAISLPTSIPQPHVTGAYPFGVVLRRTMLGF